MEKIGKRLTKLIEQENVTFLLGPTNTGKTYYAIERLLTHKSGYFGLPLRLLAREVYEKVIKKVSRLKVALITGEEQIIPPGAKYFISTVEAMPSNLTVDYVAVDEIQLCNDYDRGHIFTDKLLNSRGEIETVFLGSSSMEYLINKMFPKSRIIKKTRRSKLNYSGKKNLFSLPKRTAIIAFNMNDIYTIAAKIKAVKGGAAIVMGALSPQTRNAQVGMFEEGMVDYIVATDAIGMGLNLDIANVALSSKRKFDGKKFRPLSVSEISQIVGRAGRDKKDGTFGVTLECSRIDNKMVSSIENHKFEPINFLYWRTSDLDFFSLASLLKSLEKRNSHSFLVKTQNTEDENILKYLSSVKKIEDRLTNPANVRLLWEISSIPNYLKNFGHSYSELLIKIFCDISSSGKVYSDWIIRELISLRNKEDSIEMLTYKLAKTRFWNYLSNRDKWIENSSNIKLLAKETEKVLSESLHNKLINEFVDNKLKVYLSDYKATEENKITISKDNKIYFNEKEIGEVSGLKVSIFDKSSLFKNGILKNLITSMVKKKSEEYINNFSANDRLRVSVNSSFDITIQKKKIGSLYKGKDIYTPNLLIESNDFIDKKFYFAYKEKVEELVLKFIKKNFVIEECSKYDNNLKNLFFLIKEGLGFEKNSNFPIDIKSLKKKESKVLKKSKIIIGKVFAYDERILDHEIVSNRWNLALIYYGLKKNIALPKANILKNIKDVKIDILRSIGYLKINDIAVKITFIERFVMMTIFKKKRVYIFNYTDYRKFNLDYFTLYDILDFLGFTKIAGTNIITYWKRKLTYKNKYTTYNENSPFYILKKLQ